ncbi:hypothetical protein HUJ04_000175 [Dendroctonus ponderosae]
MANKPISPGFGYKSARPPQYRRTAASAAHPSATMRTFQVLFCLVALYWSGSGAVPNGNRPEPSDSLRLVHVLFRHGNRNPEASSIWDGNAYANESFYPEGFGQLINAGKRTEHNLGKLLRARFDSFLGDIWNINVMDVRTTDYNRTKMSGLLVLAGLWPPRGANIWNPELPWQPIPYNYYAAADDQVLASVPSGASSLLAERFADEDTVSYLSSRYGEVMEVLAANTGIEPDDFLSAFTIYDVIKVQTQLGFEMDGWTAEVYPEPLGSLAVDYYYIMTNTTALRRALSGPLIQKILQDTQSLISGTLSPEGRKLFVYSAHDVNVGNMLRSLDAYALDQSPPYGACVIFEVHEVRGQFGIKLFYVDYEEDSPKPLSIPGCPHFCPVDRFYALVEEILPV